MSAAHLPLRMQGEFLGDLITVGQRVMLFTVRADLADLDGCTFDSPDAAHDAAAAKLAAAIRLRVMAA